MSKPNFFCSLEAVNNLLQMEFNGTYQDIDITMDLIEAPYLFIYTSDKENQKIQIMKRGEIYTHDESGIKVGELVVDRKTDEGTGSTSDPIMSENMGAFFESCRNLSYFIQENKMENLYKDLDPEEAGVLLESNGTDITFKVVKGKERPELMCETLFGGTVMMRPYMDDFWERSEGDFMTLEEKIEAAEEGNEYIMEQLAMAYLNGDDEVTPDVEKAVYWFAKLAELDNSDAQFNLGLHYAEGCGIERDFEKAVYWFERAAENGDEDAPAIIEKIQKAVAAEQIISSGDAQAQADLAEVYMFLGNSLSQADPEENYAIAFDYAQKSAAQNNGDGIWALALAYEHGRGVEQDTAKAVELYIKGAELGHAPSQHSFACYLFRGDFLEQDYKKAFELCMKSAEQGYGLAMADVGRCYQFGNGVTGNMKTAVEWYEKSLEVIYDPELERKVSVFKMIGESDENWGEDYSEFDGEDFDDEDFDDEVLPEGFMATLEAFGEAQAYELELADSGVLPDAPVPGIDELSLSIELFPRVSLKVEEGDRRALDILAKFNAAKEVE